MLSNIWTLLSERVDSLTRLLDVKVTFTEESVHQLLKRLGHTETFHLVGPLDLNTYEGLSRYYEAISLNGKKHLIIHDDGTVYDRTIWERRISEPRKKKEKKWFIGRPRVFPTQGIIVDWRPGSGIIRVADGDQPGEEMKFTLFNIAKGTLEEEIKSSSTILWSGKKVYFQPTFAFRLGIRRGITNISTINPDG